LETLAILLQTAEQTPDAFEPYIHATLQLLRTVQADVNRNGQVSAAAVGLFGDLVRTYKEKVVNQIDKPLKQLIYEASVDLVEYKARYGYFILVEKFGFRITSKDLQLL
jgi:hypothetical protein